MAYDGRRSLEVGPYSGFLLKCVSSQASLSTSLLPRQSEDGAFEQGCDITSGVRRYTGTVRSLYLVFLQRTAVVVPEEECEFLAPPSSTVLNTQFHSLSYAKEGLARGLRTPNFRAKSELCDAFLQCFEVLKTFAQSVSRCWIVTPWSLHQRIYFLRFHILQLLLIFFCHEPFLGRLFLIRPLTELFTPA